MRSGWETDLTRMIAGMTMRKSMLVLAVPGPTPPAVRLTAGLANSAKPTNNIVHDHINADGFGLLASSLYCCEDLLGFFVAFLMVTSWSHSQALL